MKKRYLIYFILYGLIQGFYYGAVITKLLGV